MKRRYHGTLSRTAVLALVSTLLAGSGCVERAVAEPRLEGGATSLAALGAGVWAALTRGDQEALDSLRLTEHEHNTHVWPEQPAAAERSARDNLDFWWRNIQIRNRAAVDDLLPALSGSRLELRETVCVGEPRRYRTYRALTECHLVLAGAGGERRIQPFRHVIEMDGRYKVVRYYGSE